MTPSKAALERRIRGITAGPPRGRLPLAFLLIAAAGVASLGATTLPVPQPPSLIAVAVSLRSQLTVPESPGYDAPLPDGSLPGDPGQEHLAAGIRPTTPPSSRPAFRRGA